jgi:hypothetical protein
MAAVSALAVMAVKLADRRDARSFSQQGQRKEEPERIGDRFPV